MIYIYIYINFLYIIYIHIYYIIFHICNLPHTRTHARTHFLGELRKLPPPFLCKRVGSNYVKMLVVKPKSYLKPLPLHKVEQQVIFELLLKVVFIMCILDLAYFL